MTFSERTVRRALMKMKKMKKKNEKKKNKNNIFMGFIEY